jgi:hypothetical protein
MMKVIKNSIIVKDDMICGELIMNDGAGSSVIISGSDNMELDTEELQRLYKVIQNLPEEIVELKSRTYSIRLEGDNAVKLMLELIKLSIYKIQLMSNNRNEVLNTMCMELDMSLIDFANLPTTSLSLQ